MAAARRKTRGPLKGRALVAIGLAVFMVVAITVVWRRGVGVATAREMRKLDMQQRALETERTTLNREISEASSRPRIVSAAEKLGMHVATDAQTRMPPGLPSQ